MPQAESTASPVQLDRKLNPLHVWALAFGCIIGWGSFILPGTMFLPSAGPAGTAVAMCIAAVVMVVVASSYSYMIARYPQAGGEFAYVHRVFGRRHAFAASWLLGLCYLALVAQNATALALVARSLLGGALQFGFHYSVAGYDVYLGELLLAEGALALFAFLSIRGVRLTGVFQTVLVLALAGGVGVVVLAALCSPDASLLAATPPFSPETEPLAGVLAVLAVAPFAFVGFDTVPQAAEEYHFPPAQTKMLVVFAILFGALVYVSLSALAASVQPAGYESWPEYVSALSGLQGVQSLPTFYAAYALLGPVGLGVVATAALGAILSGIVGFYLASSRLLFAMGREGTLPAWFAEVHPRYRTPRNAIVFVFAVSLAAPFFGRTVLGWLVDMSSLGAAVAYVYTSLAAFKTAREEQRQGTGGSRVAAATGAVGALFSLVFVALLLVPFPGLDASLGAESYACLFAWVALGAVFFALKAKAVGDREAMP